MVVLVRDMLPIKHLVEAPIKVQLLKNRIAIE